MAIAEVPAPQRRRGRRPQGGYSSVSPPLNDQRWNVLSLPVLAYITDNPSKARDLLKALENKLPQHMIIDSLAWLKLNGMAWCDERDWTWRAI